MNFNHLNSPVFSHGFQVKKYETTAAVFPRRSQNRKSNNDDKHDHGQEKRILSTYVEGKTTLTIEQRQIQTNLKQYFDVVGSF